MFRMGHNLIVLAALAVFCTAPRAEAGFVSTAAGDSFALDFRISEDSSSSSDRDVRSPDEEQWLAGVPNESGMAPVTGGASPVSAPAGCAVAAVTVPVLSLSGVLSPGREPKLHLPVLDLDTPPPRM